MRQVYRHYTECEEFFPDNGMWRIVTGQRARESYSVASAELLRDPEAFRCACFHVIEEWPNSCEVNMTSAGSNRRAWFGWAACFLFCGSPEDCTRLGWHTLTDDEQHRANAIADEAIENWQRAYRPLVLISQELRLFDNA